MARGRNRAIAAWKIDPENSTTLKNLASVLGTISQNAPPEHRLRLLREAEARFKGAVTIDNNFAEAWNNLGIVLAREAYHDPVATGKLKEAVYCFARAAKLEPENIRYRDNLERAKRESGIVDEPTN